MLISQQIVVQYSFTLLRAEPSFVVYFQVFSSSVGTPSTLHRNEFPTPRSSALRKNFWAWEWGTYRFLTAVSERELRDVALFSV